MEDTPLQPLLANPTLTQIKAHSIHHKTKLLMRGALYAQ